MMVIISSGTVMMVIISAAISVSGIASQERGSQGQSEEQGQQGRGQKSGHIDGRIGERDASVGREKYSTLSIYKGPKSRRF